MKKTLRIVSVLLVAVLMMAVMVACVPQSAADAKEKMEEKGYIGGSTSLIALLAPKADDIAIFTDGSESITAVWFAESADAKDFYEDCQDDDNKNENLGRSGKCVYYGTEQAVKDFKGM